MYLINEKFAQQIAVCIWPWLMVGLFLFGCASLVEQRLQSEYPQEKLSQIEKQKWQIEGKISYANFRDSKQNFVGNFVWQSDQGEFNLSFYNQISNQSAVVSGNYFSQSIQLIQANQTTELNNLNQVLQQFFGLNLNWQDLVFWLAYQIPQSAQNLELDSENEIISFDYQNLNIGYLSFFDQIIKNENLLPIKKVKLFNLIKFDQENKKVSQLRIALSQFNFQSI